MRKSLLAQRGTNFGPKWPLNLRSNTIPTRRSLFFVNTCAKIFSPTLFFLFFFFGCDPYFWPLRCCVLLIWVSIVLCCFLFIFRNVHVWACSKVCTVVCVYVYCIYNTYIVYMCIHTYIRRDPRVDLYYTQEERKRDEER